MAGPENEEAVTPVIGVILMVAVTLVLAAVVMVIAGSLNKASEEPSPTLAFHADEANDKLTLIQGNTQGLRWNQFRLYVPDPPQPVRADFNRLADASSDVAGDGVNLPNILMVAGHYMSFCADTAFGPQAVEVVDLDTNSMVYRGTFLRLAVC